MRNERDLEARDGKSKPKKNGVPPKSRDTVELLQVCKAEPSLFHRVVSFSEWAKLFIIGEDSMSSWAQAVLTKDTID